MKRYDDASLLLAAVAEHGFDNDQARKAIRRNNQMSEQPDARQLRHANDDRRWALCTFVVMPRR